MPEPDVFDLDEVSQVVLMVIGPASTEKVHDQIVELLVQRYTDAELSELYGLHRFWAEQEGDETKALVTINLALRALLKKRGGGV